MIKLNIIMKGDGPMSFLWLILLAVIIVLIIYLVVHRVLVNHATLILKNHAEEITNKAVNDSLSKISGQHFSLSSEIVADVWGRGVLAFEFHFIPEKYNLTKEELNRKTLEKQLSDYAKQNNIEAYDESDIVFKVTDWWKYEDVLHIDVAYVLNEATREYIADLQRLAQHSK